jgi:peptidoglycan/LPS O-acetylase OafA/YrhL
VHSPVGRLTESISPKTCQLGYRPDIDVLRAVAVLSVLCFHWNVRAFSGGYVGVDVFFVISGFLITKILLKDAAAGRFSFVGFYERRIRRIVPALYAIIATTAFAACFFLLPPQFSSFARSVVAVTVFSSNILFWWDAGYFDASAITKPLLHTWSLAVEEQFYLVLPVLIMLLHRGVSGLKSPKNICTIFVLLGLASFSYNVVQMGKAPSSAFYLAPGRAWEFLIGSILATGYIPASRNFVIQFIGLTIGLSLLASAIFLFDSKTAFPGAAALVPCGGAAIFLWANTHRLPRPLELKIVAVPLFFGRISYSLYLWHWPLWVFALLWLHPDEDFLLSTKLEMFILATAMSFVSYRLIEATFRSRTMVGRNKIFIGAGLSSALIFSFGFLGIALDGFPNRLPPNIAALGSYAHYPRSTFYREDTCFLEPSQTIDAYNIEKCATAELGERSIFLVGDSTAAHYFPGLEYATTGHSVKILQANSASCPPFYGLSLGVSPNCKAMNDLVLERLKIAPPKAILISANWRYYSEAVGYDAFLNLLKNGLVEIKDGIHIVIFGPSIEYKEPLPTLLASLALRRIDISRSAKLALPRIFNLDRRMKSDLSKIPNVTYVSILSAMCPSEACPLTTDGIPVQWDAVHLTEPGSKLAISAVLPELGPILFSN